MKKQDRGRIFTFLMVVVMAATVLIATPVDVQAESAYPTELTIYDDSSDWGYVPTGAEYHIMEMDIAGFVMDIDYTDTFSTYGTFLPVSYSFTLSAPTGLWISGNTLHWNHVSNATAFRVYIDNVPMSGNLYGHSFNLANIGWAWNSSNIRVRALGDGINTFDSTLSNSVSFGTVTGTLSAPTNLWISGNTLHWNHVSNATAFRVYIDNVPVSGRIYGSSFNLSNIGWDWDWNWNWNWAWGSSNIRVRALGDGINTFDSVLSSSVSFNAFTGALSAPTGVWISGSTLHWNSVAGASAYRVYVGGVAVTGRVYGTSLNLANVGWDWDWHWHRDWGWHQNWAWYGNNIQVRALGNNSTTFNSSLSSVTSWANWDTWVPAPTPTPTPTPEPTPAPTPVLATAEGLRLEGNVLHWDSVRSATGYVIYVDGVVSSPSTVATHFSLNALALPAGSYNVQVRVLGDGLVRLNSELSAGIVFATAGPRVTPPDTETQAVPTPTPIPISIIGHEAPSNWAFGSVNTAISEGLVPQNLQAQYTQTITRAEFAALVVALCERVTGEQILYDLQFYDTEDINVMKLGTIGVVEGIGRGYFMPNDVITREQAAVVLVRLADVMGRSFPRADATFSDNASIALWAIDAVGQLQAAGIIYDISDDTFSPHGVYTREQSIVIMLRMFDNLR